MLNNFSIDLYTYVSVVYLCCNCVRIYIISAQEFNISAISLEFEIIVTLLVRK